MAAPQTALALLTQALKLAEGARNEAAQKGLPGNAVASAKRCGCGEGLADNVDPGTLLVYKPLHLLHLVPDKSQEKVLGATLVLRVRPRRAHAQIGTFRAYPDTITSSYSTSPHSSWMRPASLQAPVVRDHIHFSTVDAAFWV